MGKFRKEAEEAYQVFCQTLDQMDWKYEKEPEDLTIRTGVNGEDIPMDLIIVADEGSGRLTIYSQMPFVIREDKIVDAALVVNDFNWVSLVGFFDLELDGGGITYKLPQCIAGSRIDIPFCDRMLQIAIRMIDTYNDKFMMLNKGLLSAAQIIELVNS